MITIQNAKPDQATYAKVRKSVECRESMLQMLAQGLLSMLTQRNSAVSFRQQMAVPTFGKILTKLDQCWPSHLFLCERIVKRSCYQSFVQAEIFFVNRALDATARRLALL